VKNSFKIELLPLVNSRTGTSKLRPLWCG